MNQFDVIPSDQYCSLAGVIDQVLIDNDYSEHFFSKFLSWGMWGLRELHLDSWQELKTVEMPITDVKTCIMPVDFVDVVKLGYKQGQYILTLAVCSELAASERTLENTSFNLVGPAGLLPNGADVSQYTGGYYFNNYGGNTLFAYGGGLPSKGSYKIIKRNGCYELLLDIGVPSDTIYMEYISTGMNCCGETTLDPYFCDYVRCYVQHQYEKFMPAPRRSEAAITRTGRDLWTAEMKVRGRKSDLSPANCLLTQRRSYRLTNKA